MVYATPFLYLFIYWPVTIACRARFVLLSCKSIIINFIAISKKIIYTLSSSCMNRSITFIGYICNLPPLLLILDIFEHTCVTTFYDDTNLHMNTVQLMVSKFLTFHENTELLPSGGCYDISTGNNGPTEHIMHVLFGIPARNQLGFVEVTKEDR